MEEGVEWREGELEGQREEVKGTHLCKKKKGGLSDKCRNDK